MGRSSYLVLLIAVMLIAPCSFADDAANEQVADDHDNFTRHVIVRCANHNSSSWTVIRFNGNGQEYKVAGGYPLHAYRDYACMVKGNYYIHEGTRYCTVHAAPQKKPFVDENFSRVCYVSHADTLTNHEGGGPVKWSVENEDGVSQLLEHRGRQVRVTGKWHRIKWYSKRTGNGLGKVWVESIEPMNAGGGEGPPPPRGGGGGGGRGRHGYPAAHY